MTSGEEKRKQKRCPLMAEIHYESNSPVLTGRISDISAGGIFIDTVNALELGSHVKFRLRLPCGDEVAEIQGEGTVTWRQETVGMGLRFTRMSRGDWEKIKAFVQAQGG